MRTFTEDEIASLIGCPKQVVDPPRREMRLEGKHRRNDLTLRSENGRDSFRAFLRQSDEFQEDFSIGLTYVPGDEPGSFQLVRCNGKHGGDRVHPHHAVFHVHRSKADDVNAGILEPRHIEQAAYSFFSRGVGALLRYDQPARSR